MQEFICAYQTIYTKATASKSFTFWGSSKEVVKKGEYVKATRYGFDKNGDYLLETYTICSSGKCEKITYNGLPNKDTKINKRRISRDMTFEEHLNQASVEVFQNATLDEINRMMVRDGQSNYRDHSSLFWWVDIALETVERSSTSKFVNAFGLPNQSKFLSSFGNFGNLLPKDQKSRMFAGNGVAMSTGEVSSLSMFIQTAYLKNRPIVHHVPGWLEFSFFYDTALGDFLSNYYATRFAWIFNLSRFSGTRAEEKRASYASAESLAEVCQ